MGEVGGTSAGLNKKAGWEKLQEGQHRVRECQNSRLGWMLEREDCCRDFCACIRNHTVFLIALFDDNYSDVSDYLIRSRYNDLSIPILDPNDFNSGLL